METAIMIHNLTEDFVSSEIDKVCAEIERSGQNADICTCGQCRLDAACYVLNRSKPAYVVSDRGVAHLEDDPLARNQETVDTTVLVYKALRQVAHNQRPFFSHSGRDKQPPAADNHFVYNIPAVIGRLFNGVNFEPLEDVNVELHHGGKLAAMRDFNWQNPFSLAKTTDGTFSFWPAPMDAEKPGERSAFEFSMHVKADGFEPLNHFFDISVVGEESADVPFSMDRTYRLRDMYLFPQGSGADDF
jgi:competence protein ComFB